MTSKSALYALAVFVLMGSMSGVALADHEETNGMYGPADASLSADPERDATQPDAEGVREPIETGAVPDRDVSSSELGSGTVGDEPAVEIGGQSFRHGLDDGS